MPLVRTIDLRKNGPKETKWTPIPGGGWYGQGPQKPGEPHPWDKKPEKARKNPRSV